MTGTMEFMAIEVLQGAILYVHTYRHDLESFVYVFLWICARQAWDRVIECNKNDRPEKSVLAKWYIGSYEDIATFKEVAMSVRGLDKLLEQFPQALDRVKPLCREIRAILFSYMDGLSLHRFTGGVLAGVLSAGLFLGTLQNPAELYGPIIEALTDALSSIR